MTMRNVHTDSLAVRIVGLLVSLRAHDALHVARPAVRVRHQGTRGRGQTLGDCRLLNLNRPTETRRVHGI